MSKGYFITSTGTGVGKTFTTCALIEAAKAQNKPISARKPVLTGSGEIPNDATLIRDALGASNVNDICGWQFAAPLAPHRAAALEGKEMSLEAIVAFSKAGAGLQLVEGVGGVMVPLTNSHTVLDWAKTLDWPVIVVTGSYLGSISHTLTALSVMRAAGLRVAALIINETQGSTVSVQETRTGLMPFVQNIAHVVVQERVENPKHAREIQQLLGVL